MTQEEKAKAYNKIVDRAKKELNTCGSLDCDAARQIFRLVPELKESEDEKIRKAVIDAVETLSDSPLKVKMLAWLEKQAKCEIDYPQNHQDVDRPNGCIVLEDFNGGDGFYKVHLDYLNKKQVEEIEEIIRVWNKELKTSNEKQGEQKPADKVEPKFKVGDWVVCCDYKPIQIIGIRTSAYEMSNGDIRPFNIVDHNHNIRLWTIKNAKDGDVLCTYECGSPKIVFILKGTPKKHYALSYRCYYNIMYPHFESDSEKGCLAPNKEDVKPATKEQRELLFKKMKEAGYEWDAEKKELKKIEPKTAAWTPIDEQRVENLLAIIEGHGYPGEVAWLNSLKDRVQPKQEWSREDSVRMDELCTFIQDYGDNFYCSSLKMIVINWLKSIKERVVPQQKQEWSEEDESNIESAIYYIRREPYLESIVEPIVAWLRNLKDRYTWKPSLAQLNALGVVAKGNAPDDIEEINSLYNDLHKLIN